MGREKPFAHNAAVDRMRRQQLDDASFDRYAASGRSQPFAVSMLSNAANPVIPGAIRYVQINDMVTVWFSLFPGPASTLGGIQWRLIVPVQPAPPAVAAATTGYETYGTWSALDGSSGVVIQGWMAPQSGGTSFYFKYRDPATGAQQYVGNALPWAWDTAINQDVLTGFITYPALYLYATI